MESTDEKCNHTYTTLGSRVFRCDTKPHPNRPSRHYFVRDPEAEVALIARQRNPGRLIVLPGEHS